MWLLNLDPKCTIKIQVAEQYIIRMVQANVIPFKPFELKPKQGTKLELKLELLQFEVVGGKEAQSYLAVDEKTMLQYKEKYNLEII